MRMFSSYNMQAMSSAVKVALKVLAGAMVFGTSVLNRDRNKRSKVTYDESI